MKLDYDIVLAWVESRFDSVLVAGKEIKVNSIFTDDHKHHLWVCPEKSVFHCWKSDEKGSLTKLVAIVDGCSYSEAAERIGAKETNSIRIMEAKLQEIQDKEKIKPKQGKMTLPPNTFRIASLSQDNHYRLTAEHYIKNRKLPLGNLMVCISGEYKDRIVIPYYSIDGSLMYWNSRDLTNKAYLRYRGPDKSCGIGKGDVLWMDNWPRSGTKVYLTEGEFDAMSLNLTGVTAGACGGKAVSEKQMELLKQNVIAIAFDTDKSGTGALHKLGSLCEHYPKDVQVTYIRPPTKYKDWNEMLIDTGPRVMTIYIQQNEQALDLKARMKWCSKLF